MQANKLYDCSSTSFFTLLICLQSSDDDLGNVMYEGMFCMSQAVTCRLFMCKLFKTVVEYTKHNKKVLETYLLEMR